ncbi:MAG: response regulator, partial [Bacteroidota bacterium]
MKDRISTVLVDQHYDFANSFRSTMALHCPELEIMAVARTANEGLDLIKELKPQVVFLDFNLDGDSASDLLDCFPDRDFSFIALAHAPDMKIKALKQGALEYLLKPLNIESLVGL